ncbi:MAG: glycosyltransferase family 4 protein [Acidimicrobiia bacterium]|nr:glycosyltransferase family 4 protein [Acidimicrobiia bacterium]
MKLRSPTLVGVNLLWLVPGVVGGSEEYIGSSLRALAEHPPADLAVRLFALDAFRDAHADLVEAFPTSTLALRGRLKSARVAAESTWLAGAARRARVEVMHHAGGVVPFGSPRPSVVTIHDIQPLDLPENFSTLKRRYLGAMLPRAARQAEIVAVSSRFVAGTVVERFGLDPARVRVVPPCLTPRAEGAAPADVAARRGISRPYVVYPGITYPHKNHRVLIDALARFRSPRLELVLAGGEGSEEGALAEAIDGAGLRDRVHRVGRIPRAELDALIGASSGLVMPSRYEGFGMPVLEAMAVGVPVVVADRASLPEVGGDAVLRLDPDDVGAWASALAELATGRGPAVRAARSGKGRSRAASYDPERTAKALAAAYRAAAGRPGDQVNPSDPG